MWCWCGAGSLFFVGEAGFVGDFAFWCGVCSFAVEAGTDSVVSFVFGGVETGSFGGPSSF